MRLIKSSSHFNCFIDKICEQNEAFRIKNGEVYSINNSLKIHRNVFSIFFSKLSELEAGLINKRKHLAFKIKNGGIIH